MQSKLLDLVESSSKLNLLDTAHFYASLLYSINKSTISVYSYAFTLYNTNRHVESYDLLIDNYSEIEYDIKSWLLLSDVCEKLNLHSDAMRASKQAHDLLHLNKLIPTGILTTGSTSSPAATACRLGRIAKTTNNHKSAIEYFNQALSLDHSIWEAFEALCALGALLIIFFLSFNNKSKAQIQTQRSSPPTMVTPNNLHNKLTSLPHRWSSGSLPISLRLAYSLRIWHLDRFQRCVPLL